MTEPPKVEVGVGSWRIDGATKGEGKKRCCRGRSLVLGRERDPPLRGAQWRIGED